MPERPRTEEIASRHRAVQMVTRGLFGSFYMTCDGCGQEGPRDDASWRCDAARLAEAVTLAAPAGLREALRDWMAEASDHVHPITPAEDRLMREARALEAAPRSPACPDEPHYHGSESADDHGGLR